MKIGAIPENVFEWLMALAGLAPIPVVDTLHSVIAARAIMVATKLGIFDACASRSLSAQELAEQLGIDARALEKLLNVLVSTGYLRFRAQKYAPTRLARTWLMRDSPQSLHDNVLLRFLEWQAVEATEDFVRTGKPLDVHDLILGEQWEVYQRGMRALARLSAGEVARRLRLPSGARTMLDVGGGHGSYSVAFCRRNPQLQASILDLPAAVESAGPILAEEKMAQRVVHVPGNALTEDLGEDKWDLIFISHLVHHLDRAANEGLIRRASRGLRAGATLAILDVLRPSSPNATGQTGALLDLYFAITSNSGTWSYQEITGWLEGAELCPGRVISLRSAPSIVVVPAIKPRSRR